MHTDAQKKTNGLSPVAMDIVQIVLADPDYWPRLKQLIKTMKPIVDTIGNLESCEACLHDCMLEFIQCACQMQRVQFEEGKTWILDAHQVSFQQRISLHEHRSAFFGTFSLPTVLKVSSITGCEKPIFIRKSARHCYDQAKFIST